MALVSSGPGRGQLSPAGEKVQKDDSHHAGTEIARRRDAQAEAPPAGKAQGLVAGTHVVGLARPLAEAHGQQQAGRLEHAGHHGIGEPQADYKPCHTLNEVGADDDRAGFEPRELFRGRASVRHAQAHGDKAQRYAMIHQHFHKGRVQLHKPRVFQDQQQKARHDGNRHQALSDKAQLRPQEICQQNGPRDEAKLLYHIPERRVRRGIIHFNPPFPSTPDISSDIRPALPGADNIPRPASAPAALWTAPAPCPQCPKAESAPRRRPACRHIV